MTQAFITDHRLIHYEFNAFVGSENGKGSRYIYDYNKTNFDDLRSSFVNIALLSCVGCVAHDDVNENWKSWKTSILNMIIKLLKLNGSKRKLNNPFPPCLTITLRQSLVKSILQHTQLILSVAVFLRLYVNYSVSEASTQISFL